MFKVKRAVMIGVGMVAETHLDAIAASQKVRLHGVLSRSQKSASAFHTKACRKLGYDIKLYHDVAEVAADAEVDFVIILTPANVRTILIEPLVAAGKHILLEKPVARNATEAGYLVDLCEKADVSLGVVFQLRMREASKAAKRLIASGHLGELGLCEISVPWWRPQTYYDEAGRGTYARDGGGVLITQAIHTLDLMLDLTGDVKSVQAMAVTSRFHKMEAEDFVTAGIEFVSGAAGSFMASTASYPGVAETIILYFEHATLRLHSGQLYIIWRDGRKETVADESASGAGANPMAFSYVLHQDLIDDFAVSLNCHRKPMVSGREALKVHELIDIIMLSSKSGRREYLS
ncbi:Gfo/Idh/MocA family protein [Brucellaceae bacterium C25G]